MQKNILRSLLLITLLLAVLILAQCSFLSIGVSGNDGKTTYNLLKLGQTKARSWSGSPSATRLVAHGEYEVMVTSANKSAFGLTKTGHFFSKTKIDMNLQPENKRTYVGDNPGSCMVLTDKLYSYECGNSFSSINVHVPATTDQPGYSQQVPQSTIEGSVEGTAWTGQGLVALVHPVDSEGPGGHVLYSLSDQLSATASTVLSTLNNKLNYEVQPFGDGFVAYNNQLDSVYFYSGSTAQPTKIDFKPGQGFYPVALSAMGNSIVASYSTQAPATASETTSNSKSIKNQILVYQNGSVKTFHINDVFVANAVACSDSLLCVQVGDNAFIYKTTQKTPRLLHRVSKVLAIEVRPKGVYFVRGDGVLNINPETGTGNYSYSFGNYSYCGFSFTRTGYAVCVLDKNKRLALSIDTSANDTDSIDKKVQQLSLSKYVTDISVYDHLLFITPNLGKLQYQASAGGYDYDPATKKTATNEIGRLAKSLGIDGAGYKTTVTIH